MKKKNFRMPNDLVELSITALKTGHRIKLSSLLPPVPTEEDVAEEATLWEVADEIESQAYPPIIIMHI